MFKKFKEMAASKQASICTGVFIFLVITTTAIANTYPNGFNITLAVIILLLLAAAVILVIWAVFATICDVLFH